MAIAKQMPCAGLNMAVFTPMTLPFEPTSGPPEFPGFSAASVWMTSSTSRPVCVRRERPSALTTPAVTVNERPKGFPIATAILPTLSERDSPKTGRPFSVYCDMTQHHGGWTQFAKLSNSATDSVKGAFTLDRNVSNIVSNSAPVAGTFASLNLARFDAYGRDYTIRIATDTTNLGQQFQYTFYRPAVTQALLPSVAGANWTGTDTATKMEYLVMASAAGLTNTTWLPTPVWDIACGNEVVVFGSRLVAYISSGDCLSSDGQTQLCHAPAGALLSGCGLPGTFTAATSQGDGVPHSHGHDATYWIKEANISGTP